MTRFVEPCFPTTRPTFPKGPDWLHEIKFDGYRVQLHKEGKRVKIYSRRGADFTERYAPIAEALAKLPTKEAIIDGELVALREDGTPFCAVTRTPCCATPKALSAPTSCSRWHASSVSKAL